MPRRRLTEIEPPESPVVEVTSGGPKKAYRKRFIRRILPQKGKYRYEQLDIDWLKLIAVEARMARYRLHLSQRTLAHELRTGQSEISKFENNKNNPTVEFIERLLRELKLRLDVTVRQDD